MPLTPTQRDWATAQVGTEAEAVLDGIITKKSGLKGDYTMEVTGDDGTATFDLATQDVALADEHVGLTSSVRIEGKVTKVTLDEAGGRVGLVVTADNGTVTQWHVPEMSDAEIADAVPTVEEKAQEKIESDRIAAERVANDKANLKERIVDLLGDPAFVTAFRNALK